jgi:hypothetical protein
MPNGEVMEKMRLSRIHPEARNQGADLQIGRRVVEEANAKVQKFLHGHHDDGRS